MICPQCSPIEPCQIVEIDNEDEPDRNLCRVCQEMELAIRVPITDSWFWDEQGEYFIQWLKKMDGK